MIVLTGLFAVASFLFVLYIIQLIRKHKRLEGILSKNFPGPEKKFFIGNALDYAEKKGMLVTFRKYQCRYGDIVYSRVGPAIHTLIICDPLLASVVFHSRNNLNKGHAYEFTKGWLGNGLLTTGSETWQQQRKMCEPFFDFNSVKEYVPIFNKHAKYLVEKLVHLEDKNSINIHKLVGLCSLDIICETSLGVELNAQKNQNTDYTEAVKEMCRIVADRSCSLLKLFDFLYRFSKDYQKEQKCVRLLHAYTEKCLKERREKRNSDGPTYKMTGPQCFLDHLLDHSENETGLSEDEIKNEIHTFMFAGHDTVTAAMSFFLYEIAKHEEVQEELFAEQQNLIEMEETDVSVDSISKMPLLDLAMKECLRLYPPVPVYTRKVTNEFKYSDKEKVIPEDVVLTYFIYGMHRSEKYFENPDTFIFRRFEDAKFSREFLPFSSGFRSCIGKRYAMFEMKVILSNLIRNFKLLPAEPEHEIDLRAEVVLTSKNGIKIKVVKR